MAQDHIQALNYSAHAIEDLQELARSLRQVMPAGAATLLRICELLDRSVKFILPNCADFFDVEKLDQKHLDLVHLPFPIVAFEAPWEKDAPLLEINGQMQERSTRRIALCWEPAAFELIPGMSGVLEHFPEGGVFILPVYWLQTTGTWQVPIGCVFQPYKNTVLVPDDDALLPASLAALEKMRDAGRTTAKVKHYRSEPVPILAEAFEQLVAKVGQNDALMQIILDCGDEANMLLQSCCMINCSNIAATALPAPVALNRKREARGKQPFFEYKVLQLSDEKPATSIGPGSGGTHASPRMHLRRGYIHTRKATGRSHWVSATVVNSGSTRGVVEKDYLV